jgi:hypothetical protein
MATPGYPNQMGQMPIRRGTSKAVPVVVSAGLAVGVFCGLLFGVGTGKKEAQAAPPSASNVKKDDEQKGPAAAPEGLGATSTTPVKPATPATGSTTPTVAAAGSAATPTTPTTPSVPAVKVMKLTVKIKPDAAASAAKLLIDGTEVTGMTTDIPLDKKTVKVQVKADGYRTGEKKIDVSEGDMSLELELSKRSSGSGTGGVHAPKRPDRPPSSGGGLIDI